MRARRAASRAVLAVLSAAYLWAVGWLTLRARPYGADVSEVLERLLAWFSRHRVTEWITLERMEFAANIAMFVPLGVFAVLWFGVRGWWSAPVLGLVLSGAIELAQALLLDTRVPDVRDLVANTIGSVVGMLLMLLLAFLLVPSRPRR
ncbi:MAG: VanZ family protein [Microbacterium sp.]